jgi:hypothetical protein
LVSPVLEQADVTFGLHANLLRNSLSLGIY